MTRGHILITYSMKVSRVQYRFCGIGGTIRRRKISSRRMSRIGTQEAR